MRVKNLEFIRNSGSDRGAEIVGFGTNSNDTEYRYTILWWREDKEGYHIEFVGDRPLQIDDRDTLWHLMAYGQTVMDAEYKLMEITFRS